MTFNQSLRILMIGFEWPPFNSGGLGVACEGLVKGLAEQGVRVVFVLPKKLDCQSSFCKLIFADESLKIKGINSPLSPYLTSKSYGCLIQDNGKQNIYGSDLFKEVARYAKVVSKIARSEVFDIIHCHDWLSFPAGLEVKKISSKPLIAHLHATEFDRTGGYHLNSHIYEIEKQGLEKAELVIANSNFTKNKAIQHYGINSEKIRVVYNAVEENYFSKFNKDLFGLKSTNKKIVLFVGRITLQKGPDYFIKAAKKVLERNSDVVFVIAGSGDMEVQIIEQATQLGIADKILFAGFLRDNDLAKAYQMADLYVLPSVSEPFGITPLEALVNETPVLISKQSGISEVLSHCLKVDFWDINEMANKILAVLEHPELYRALKENGHQEVKKFSWRNSARECVKSYYDVLK